MVDLGDGEGAELVSEAGEVAVRGTFPGKREERRTVDGELADSFVIEPSGQVSRRDTSFFVPAV